MDVFRSSCDYETFLLLLKRTATRWTVAVHAFVLMTNHFHLILTPHTVAALSRMMQTVNASYAQYFNRQYKRTGTLWTGRYRSLLLTDAHYWLTCLRYVEQNPVRARLVEKPDQYRWSSYPIHAAGADQDWLSSHPVYDALGSTPAERCETYRELCESELTYEQLISSKHTLIGATPGTVRLAKAV